MSSAFLVSMPDEKRRTYATVRKLWLEVNWVSASAPTPLVEYVGSMRDARLVIGMWVGAQQRLVVYPQQGFTVDQLIPRDVAMAYESLRRGGFASPLVSEAVRWNLPCLISAARSDSHVRLGLGQACAPQDPPFDHRCDVGWTMRRLSASEEIFLTEGTSRQPVRDDRGMTRWRVVAWVGAGVAVAGLAAFLALQGLGQADQWSSVLSLFFTAGGTALSIVSYVQDRRASGVQSADGASVGGAMHQVRGVRGNVVIRASTPTGAGLSPAPVAMSPGSAVEEGQSARGAQVSGDITQVDGVRGSLHIGDDQPGSQGGQVTP